MRHKLNLLVDLELSNQYLDTVNFPSISQRPLATWPRSEITSTSLTMRPSIKERSVFKTCATQMNIACIRKCMYKVAVCDEKDHFPRFYMVIIRCLSIDCSKLSFLM